MQLPMPYIFNIGAYSDPYTSIGGTLVHCMHDDTWDEKKEKERTKERKKDRQTDTWGNEKLKLVASGGMYMYIMYSSLIL